MTRFFRILTPTGWLWVGGVLLAVILIVGGWAYLAGRGDGRAAQRAGTAEAELAAERRAGVGKEVAATQRTTDNAAIAAKLETWNHAAEQTPDTAPDDRDLRRRCRQLREAGRGDHPACRGLEG